MEDYNPYTKYALKIYQQPGIKELMLAFQDRFGADVPILLYCCWLATEQKCLSGSAIQALVADTDTWREECVRALRKVRRFLKEQPGQDKLYQQVKQVELQSEMIQLEWLWEQFDTLALETSDSPFIELIRKNAETYSQLLSNLDQPDGIAELVDQLVDLLDE